MNTHETNRPKRPIHTTLYLKIAEYTSFPSAHGTFPRRDHTLAHKTKLQ